MEPPPRPSTPQSDLAAAAAAAAAAAVKPPKHSRTAVACRRCKSRKQKCDGKHLGRCSNCANSASTCEYDVSPLPSYIRTQYLRAAQRVQELEGIVSQAGLLDHGPTEWPDPDELISGSVVAIPSKRSQDDSREKDELLGRTSSPAESDPNRRGGSPASTESFVHILRDLSIEANGGYVNGSVNLSMGRVFDTLVKDKESLLLRSGQLYDGLLSPRSTEAMHRATLPYSSGLSFDGIPPSVADRMLYGYFRHIYTLWPIFPMSFIRRLHINRAQLTDDFEVATLHLVYGAGGRYLETTGETGSFESENHYVSAAALLERVLQLHDIRSIQILLLFAIYGLRAPRGPGAWSFAGMAIRMSIELGLHRRKRLSKENSDLEALRRCVFWSCYCLDRQISIILGRPFAISDHDIDAELPSASGAVGEEPSSVECFIHICRLRIIESHIQQTIYRVDQPCDSVAELDSCLHRLEMWRSEIPSGSTADDPASINRSDYYMVYYYKCLRYLLHPHVSSPQPQLSYVQKCVEACGGICQTYKRLHQDVTVGFSLMALHSVFFAGLTLLYCSWISPKEIINIRTNSHMSACSIVLYIIAERWPGARKYRNIFEALKQSILEAIDDGKYEPRRAIKRLKPDMQEGLRAMQPTEACQEDLVSMIAAMSGDAADCGQGETNLAFPSFPEPPSTEDLIATEAMFDETTITWPEMPLNDDWLATIDSVVDDPMGTENFSWLL